MPKFSLLTGTLKASGKKFHADKRSPTKPVVELEEKAGAHLVKAGVLAPASEAKKEAK